jgi:osmoprotectant transport system ATP-binding protein
MGDRVAVLREGGRLAQYATPAELLMAPADDFVEDFVGADRALKRLSLLRVRDIDLWKAPLARVGEPTANVRAAIEQADLPHPLVVDDDGRPIGWLSERDLQRETVPATPDTAADPMLELDDVLRDALSHLLRSDTQYGPVIDEHGRIAGVLSVEIISHFLSSDRAAELATPPAERVS